MTEDEAVPSRFAALLLQNGLNGIEIDRVMDDWGAAHNKVPPRTLRRMEKALAQGDRRLKSWWKDEEAKVREEVVPQVDASPIMRTLKALKDGEVEKLDAAGSADNASFSTLLATGRDDYDFITRSGAGVVQRFKGYDQLGGESTVIDGVPLERCRFEMTIEDAALFFRSIPALQSRLQTLLDDVYEAASLENASPWQ